MNIIEPVFVLNALPGLHMAELLNLIDDAAAHLGVHSLLFLQSWSDELEWVHLCFHSELGFSKIIILIFCQHAG